MKDLNIEATTSAMDEMIHEFVDEHKFMGSVLVSQNGQILLKKGYGFANLEWDIPNSPTTRMQIASLSKQFTAAAILLLHDRGKLHIDDLVKKHLPDSPVAWNKITIFHLLTHTSGLYNFTDSDVDNYFTPMGTIPCTPETLTELFSNKPLEFGPGEKIAYSNSGYVVLGRIIERLSGQSYAEFLQQNIFEPLEMKDSGNNSREAILKHRASGYAVSNGGLVNTDLFDIALSFAAGSLYSTVEDLLKWELALFGGKLLSESSLQSMITPFKENYAFGLTVTTENGRSVIKHKGKNPGFKSVLSYYPGNELIVAVLGNNEEGSATFEIARLAAALIRGEEIILPRQRKELALSSEALSAYIGEYKLDNGQILAVVPLSEKLMFWTKCPDNESTPVQDTCWLSSESESKFFSRDRADIEVEFFRNNLGAVSHLLFTQGAASSKATRSN